MAPNPTVDVIIPSFNGKYLLEKNLPKVLKNSDYLNQIIVVDNGSTDGSVEWLTQNYPEIIIVKNSSNLGFTKPINQGVSFSKAEFLVLMNNDVSPAKDYLQSALRFFNDDKVFAVSFNEKKSSWPNVFWKDGKLQFIKGEDKTTPRYSAWASGGSAIFKRDIWNKLGGLDEIYAPWYWEDIDIGYRAWKTGFKIIWSPESLVFHEHESTSQKLSPKYVNLIKQRNELIFNWLNIKDKNLTHGHFWFLLKHTLSHPGYLKIIISALWRILSHRSLPRKFIHTDFEVFNLFSKPL